MTDLNLGKSARGSNSINMLSTQQAPELNPGDEEITPSLIYEIQNNFQDMQSVNRIVFPKQTGRTTLRGSSRYYYHRPTLQDILYEEDFFHAQNSYHGKTIYEWNLDGYSEYQIFELIHQIIMYATIYKQNNNSDHQIVRFIVNGFTGILKGWWDTSTQQQEV